LIFLLGLVGFPAADIFLSVDARDSRDLELTLTMVVPSCFRNKIMVEDEEVQTALMEVTFLILFSN
jgi:hypothetical protein